jgi:hypothetical protein
MFWMTIAILVFLWMLELVIGCAMRDPRSPLASGHPYHVTGGKPRTTGFDGSTEVATEHTEK